jgi:retron-type reverse transcriptase
VLDLDIKGFFDNIDWELLMRAVRRHTDCAWVLLYIERWLKAPVSMPDGTLVSREKGTPQGAVVSPILANLFLHYAFDRWMKENNLDIPFERYADDAICHCRLRRKRFHCGKRWKRGLRRVSWNCIRKRRRLCTARTRTDRTVIRSNASIFWALRFDPDNR